ncbi:MAG TPA: peptidase M19 [Oceanithermus profundus]|uniref:Peptidase M19 n=1 Tax=Oceanithermus profundus TaxID=187137 RepID=A0A7C4ZDN3_9DEIN|nr:peptidase M19 [Oceanithermus profundus]
MKPPPLVDAHLDLAHNVLDIGLDLTLSLEELRRRHPEGDVPTVTLPALHEAGAALVFATLFASPYHPVHNPEGYRTPDEAHARAWRQLELYRRWHEEGRVRLVTNRAELEGHLMAWESDGVPGLLILMEGADPIRTPSELTFWTDAGVRIVGPAWGGTRYAGGSWGDTGGLSELGRELMAAMQEEPRVALDASHLSERSFWEALERYDGPLLASHANARRFVDHERHLSDAMIRALGERGGVIGTVFYNAFLVEGWRRGDARPGLEAVVRHMAHVAELIGWEHVGIGSDFDGGFGARETPAPLGRPADLRLLRDELAADTYTGVIGENWLGWLRAWLP